MASLHQIKLGENIEFMRILSKAGFTAEDVRKIIRNQDVLDVMVTAMREHEVFRLIHGRFHPLNDKLEMVRSWPGVDGKMVDAALKEAEDRIARFEAESPESALLNIVVSIYLADAPSTLVYACDRMRETFGGDCNPIYASGIDENRVRYLQDDESNTIVPTWQDCVRIEVVDFGAHFNPRGEVPNSVRDKNSAHFAVIYAAAQDPTWVHQIDGISVPHVLACGLELNVPGCDAWMDLPCVNNGDDAALLCAGAVDETYHLASMPVLWV